LGKCSLTAPIPKATRVSLTHSHFVVIVQNESIDSQTFHIEKSFWNVSIQMMIAWYCWWKAENTGWSRKQISSVFVWSSFFCSSLFISLTVQWNAIVIVVMFLILNQSLTFIWEECLISPHADFNDSWSSSCWCS
jgi:hypothetical protein